MTSRAENVYCHAHTALRNLELCGWKDRTRCTQPRKGPKGPHPHQGTLQDPKSPTETQQSIQAALHHTTNELKLLCDEENKTKPQTQAKSSPHSQHSLNFPLPTLATLKPSSHSPSSSSLWSSERITSSALWFWAQMEANSPSLHGGCTLLMHFHSLQSHTSPCPSLWVWILLLLNPSLQMNKQLHSQVFQPAPLPWRLISFQGGTQLWKFNANPAFSPRLMCVSGFHHSYFNLLLHVLLDLKLLLLHILC